MPVALDLRKLKQEAASALRWDLIRRRTELGSLSNLQLDHHQPRAKGCFWMIKTMGQDMPMNRLWQVRHSGRLWQWWLSQQKQESKLGRNRSTDSGNSWKCSGERTSWKQGKWPTGTPGKTLRKQVHIQTATYQKGTSAWGAGTGRGFRQSQPEIKAKPPNNNSLNPRENVGGNLIVWSKKKKKKTLAGDYGFSEWMGTQSSQLRLWKKPLASMAIWNYSTAGNAPRRMEEEKEQKPRERSRIKGSPDLTAVLEAQQWSNAFKMLRRRLPMCWFSPSLVGAYNTFWAFGLSINQGRKTCGIQKISEKMSREGKRDFVKDGEGVMGHSCTAGQAHKWSFR